MKIVRRALAAALVGAVLVTGSGTVESAAADDDEAAFIEAINEIRVDLGLDELEPHEELAETARAHTQAMADAGEIFHADPISEGLTAEWVKLGENVGVGAGVQVLVDAFVASPGHYANIIDPSFTHIGVGVVWKGETLYTTHRFLQPPGTDAGTVDQTPTTTTPATDGGEPATSTASDQIPAGRVSSLLALLEDVG
jgi:uncharacterized protein YkwD